LTELELTRRAKRRLAILRHAEEITGNVALTCRYYGISRQVFYKWRQRYEQHGLDGLRDRSRCPRGCPNQTRTDVVGKIIYLRQPYHFGPAKIAMYLRRYHDIQISHSGVWRVLKRLDLNRLPASQRYQRHDRRWQRYEKPLPGHRVQLDVKFIAPLAGSRRKHYQFTAIDDCTRLRVLRIYPQLNQKMAIQFVDYVLERLPFRVEVIQTDIQTRWCSWSLACSAGQAQDPGIGARPLPLLDRSEPWTPCLLIMGRTGHRRRWVASCWEPGDQTASRSAMAGSLLANVWYGRLLSRGGADRPCIGQGDARAPAAWDRHRLPDRPPGKPGRPYWAAAVGRPPLPHHQRRLGTAVGAPAGGHRPGRGDGGLGAHP
jgi:transposase